MTKRIKRTKRVGLRKLSHFIAASIDGFIGAPRGEADFFTPFAVGDFLEYLKTECPDTLPTLARRAFGVDDAPNTQFDTIIQGRASYDLALDIKVTSPYAHLRELVASRSIEESPDPNVEIVSGDVVARIRELKQEDGLGIYLCGGAGLAGQLRDEIDELVIKTYPVVLGSGMAMFAAEFGICDFALDSVRTFDNGVLVRKYSRKR
jgi:dihydrofolate reductase